MASVGESAIYPIVPGHELSGVAVAVGKKVTKFKVGDQVGVGVISDSCLNCIACKAGAENYCATGMTETYNSPFTYGRANPGPGHPTDRTFGGFASQMVVHEHFGIKIPEVCPLEKAGPLMCAAITMYDPLKHWKAGPGVRVGIVGLGGLGTMGIKLAKAMGATVTAISRSGSKRAVALSELGCDAFVAMDTPSDVQACGKSLDLIISTVSDVHDATVCACRVLEPH